MGIQASLPSLDISKVVKIGVGALMSVAEIEKKS
jgi:hypothetical protein